MKSSYERWASTLAVAALMLWCFGGCSDTATTDPNAGTITEEEGGESETPGEGEAPEEGGGVDATTESGEAGEGGDDVDPGDAEGGEDGSPEGGESDAEEGGGDDTEGGEPDVEPRPDTTSPQVVGAFSADGVTVTVRFSEDIDPLAGSDAGNFTIFGSDNSQIGVLAASVDGVFSKLELDPASTINPALTYTVRVSNVDDLAGNGVDPQKDSAVVKRTVYLSILWHQHQPLYLDVLKDQLMSPWVRNHSTKSYYDMSAIIEQYPDVHMSVNLTIVMLTQLELYLDRLGPYVDIENNSVDEAAFMAQWEGRTDPWIDLLLRDTPTPESATEHEIQILYDAPWSCVSNSDEVMSHFPEYRTLRDKNPNLLTQQDFRLLKIFFVLSWLDPDFLNGPVELPNGWTVDLSDVVDRDLNGDIYTLAVAADEDLANRLVAESYKIMANVIPVHQRLMLDWETMEGQIEVTTTPFYHPILPLIYDTNQAQQGQPFDPLPSPAYSDPTNAFAHVAKAKAYYQNLFGQPPRGMWPGEGSVSEAVVDLFVQNGVQWIATGNKVLESSQPYNQPSWFAYKIDSDTEIGPGGTTADEMAIVFRDTELSDKIGFKFQTYKGQDAANELLADVLAKAPTFGSKDRLISVILDGENAWENYKETYDGKEFFYALYGALQEAHQIGDIITVTPTEYLEGNPKRGVPAHPVSSIPEIEPLFAGSWIDGTFAVWVGESEENQGWGCLRQAREDLVLSGLPRPNPLAPAPSASTGYPYYVWKAWEELYASEGSDWFWWYGADMTTPANDDTPFDKGFRAHISGVYEFMNLALEEVGKPTIPVFTCAPIIQAEPKPLTGPFLQPPTIDGLFAPNEAEWTDDGAFFYDDDSGGAIANPDDDVSIVYYGYDGDSLYVAVNSPEALSDKLGSNYAMALYFSHKNIINLDSGETLSDPANELSPEGWELGFSSGGAAREVRVDFSGPSATVTLSEADGLGGWLPVADHTVEVGGPLAGTGILEFEIPWADLNLSLGDPLEMSVVAIEGGEVIDAAPNLGTRVVFQDETNIIFVTLEVDVSGSSVPIDQFVDITTPPPPSGSGIVFIAGNQDSWGTWVPNKVALLDNGEGSDEVAGDQKWTATFKFPPGTLLRWKYTVGTNSNEGSWFGTEEFPLTERGYDVPLDPSVSSVILREVFADRPMPSGTLGPNTVVEEIKR